MTKCKSTILLIVFVISIVIQSCTEAKSYEKYKEKVNGAYAFTNLDYALKSAEEHDKELILFFDCPATGSCCRTSRNMIFSAFQKRKYTEKFELVYLKMDDRTKIITDKLVPMGDTYEKIETVGLYNISVFLEFKNFMTTSYLLRIDSNKEILKECNYLKDKKELNAFLL